MNTRRWILGGTFGLSLLALASLTALPRAGMRNDAMAAHAAAMGSRHFGGGLIYQLNEARRWLQG
jgi:hypothetical protein